MTRSTATPVSVGSVGDSSNTGIRQISLISAVSMRSNPKMWVSGDHESVGDGVNDHDVNQEQNQGPNQEQPQLGSQHIDVHGIKIDDNKIVNENVNNGDHHKDRDSGRDETQI